jgi:hypothetical protein
MTITYSNGTVLEAIVLAHEEEALRVAVAGEGDVRTFRRIHGVWISEECEPVAVEFAWQRRGASPALSEDDCICTKELATRLIQTLLGACERGEAAANTLYVFSSEGTRVAIHRSELELRWDRKNGAAQQQDRRLLS